MSRLQAKQSTGTPAPPHEHDPTTRAFQSPSGRTWMAYLYPGSTSAGRPGEEHAASPPAGAVLRFRSGDLVLELLEFPAEWLELPDEALIELARRAQPPRPRAP